MAASLVPQIRRTRVSSVLNRDNKQFGKQHLFDEQEETCWNSDQGSPQFIQLDFDQPAQVTEVQIQFQGGFVGKECQLEVKNTIDNKSKICNIYPNDINSLQKLIDLLKSGVALVGYIKRFCSYTPRRPDVPRPSIPLKHSVIILKKVAKLQKQT